MLPVACILGLLAGLATSGVCIALPGGNIKGVSGDAAQEAVRERRQQILTTRELLNGREGDPRRVLSFVFLCLRCGEGAVKFCGSWSRQNHRKL